MVEFWQKAGGLIPLYTYSHQFLHPIIVAAGQNYSYCLHFPSPALIIEAERIK